MRILCMTKRWAHHTQSGGYDRFARKCGAIEVRRPGCRGLLMRSLRVAWRRWYGENTYLLDYCFEDSVAELKTMVSAWLARPSIIHALYGDEHLNFLLSARPLLPCPLVATFHLPSRRVVERFEKGHRDKLRRLDGAIVVSTAQLPAFRSWLGAEKVVFIPHGIDTSVFLPPESRSSDDVLRLICVGSHMRDFSMMHRVADLCASERLNVHIDVVAAPEDSRYFTGCAGVACHSGIPEEQLIRMYQAADALLIPVTDATATNAVLESLACGTPVITTDVAGMRDYVDSSCGWLLPCGDVDAAGSLIRELSHDKAPLIGRRKAARKQAECFSWERVVEQCRDAYRNVLSTGCIAGTSARNLALQQGDVSPTHCPHDG